MERNILPYTTDQLVELAELIAEGDPIDFSQLAISQQDARRLLATSLMEKMCQLTESLKADGEEEHVDALREAMLTATILHLTLENFALQFKLLQLDPDHNADTSSAYAQTKILLDLLRKGGSAV